MADKATVSEPVPIRAIVGSQGYDPSRLATNAQFTFGPTDREKVDRAVAAFVAVMKEGADGK